MKPSKGLGTGIGSARSCAQTSAMLSGSLSWAISPYSALQRFFRQSLSNAGTGCHSRFRASRTGSSLRDKRKQVALPSVIPKMKFSRSFSEVIQRSLPPLYRSHS